MKREYYSDSITTFLNTKPDEILGKLVRNSNFDLGQNQRDAWLEEISILDKVLSCHQGSVYFEYSIPRMGKRIDVVLLIGPVIFVIEFKIGEREFPSYAKDQVWDYALDLKNFHESSHERFIPPILIATKAQSSSSVVAVTPQNDKLLLPINSNGELLGKVVESVLLFATGNSIDHTEWEHG